MQSVEKQKLLEIIIDSSLDWNDLINAVWFDITRMI